MKSSEPLRMGLIGAGAIAQTYAQAFGVAEVVKLVGVCDVRPEAAASLAEALKCETYATPEELLRGSKCDAVVICTPPNTHADLSSAKSRWRLRSPMPVGSPRPPRLHRPC
jgi:predicted dehydrogenase